MKCMHLQNKLSVYEWMSELGKYNFFVIVRKLGKKEQYLSDLTILFCFCVKICLSFSRILTVGTQDSQGHLVNIPSGNIQHVA